MCGRGSRAHSHLLQGQENIGARLTACVDDHLNGVGIPQDPFSVVRDGLGDERVNLGGSGLGLEEGVVDAEMAMASGMTEGAEIISVKRLRLLDNVPLIVDTSYFLTSMVPQLTQQIVESSIYAYLENELDVSIVSSSRLATIEPADLAKKLAATTGNYSVTTIPKTIAPTIRDQLQDDPAIIFHEEAAMVSKDPGFAPDIIARVAGLVNNQLDGSNGWRIAIVTHDGAPIEDLEHHEPKVAPAVQVSLDRKVQLAAEEAVNQRKEMKAMIVAIRPSSGEILAVAQTDKADEDGAVALSGQFPPGSTFKIITAAAGLQDQHLTPESIVPCPGATFRCCSAY